MVGSMFAELKTVPFWKAVSAEFMATLLFVWISCGTALTGVVLETGFGAANVVQISLTFGCTIFVLVHTFGHISGGHINPAVTFALAITRKITPVKAVLYVIAQCLGAVCGAAFLAVMPNKMVDKNMASTLLHPYMNASQGLLIEIITTAILVYTVFATIDSSRQHYGTGPLAIGFAVLICHLIAVPWTGCGINPARSFGPALVAAIKDMEGQDSFKDHWVYWLGPALGAAIAAMTYTFWFSEAGSLSSLKDTFGAGEGNQSKPSQVQVQAAPA